MRTDPPVQQVVVTLVGRPLPACLLASFPSAPLPMSQHSSDNLETFSFFLPVVVSLWNWHAGPASSDDMSAWIVSSHPACFFLAFYCRGESPPCSSFKLAASFFFLRGSHPFFRGLGRFLSSSWPASSGASGESAYRACCCTW